jgi:hypothetical protein
MQRLLALAAVPWIGVFNISVSGGTAEDTWSQHHADGGPCDVASSGSGSESGSLQPGTPVVVTLAGVGTTAFLTPVTGLRTTAVLDRQGAITTGPDDGDDGAGCPEGDGGDTPPAPDCGTTTLPLSFTFQPGAPPGLTAETGNDTPRYKNCPVIGSVLPSVPDTLSAPVLADGVGPAPGPGLATIPLSGTETASDADSDSTTKLSVDLRLERVATVVAADIRDSFTRASVDKRGDTRVPLTCPGPKACSGTVAVAMSNIGSEPARAVKQPTWPRPLLQPEAALGTARFKLKPHHSARVRIRLAHGNRQTLLGFADETLDLIVRQSPGGNRKPIAFVAGQAQLRLR